MLNLRRAKTQEVVPSLLSNAGAESVMEHSRSTTTTWTRLRSNPRVLVPGLILLGLLVIAAFAPLLTPGDPFTMDTTVRLQGPNQQNLLGTDEYGRDLLSRMILGSRSTVIIALSSVTIATIIGVFIGLIGGYFGGIWEIITMRTVDALLTIPPIIVAIAVVAFLGASIRNLILVIAVLYMTRFARVSFGSVLQVKEAQFVESARAIGAGPARILRSAILPNILAPIFVQISFALSLAILLESGLSFLGLGTPPPQPSWGTMVRGGSSYMQQNAWYLVWPALAISITILCCNTLGDGLRDSLDPRLKR